MVEGKLKIWIKGGSFSHSSDLYIKVMCDTREVWKTDESDSSSPSWDSTVTKHVKGEYEKLIFKLMDEDTFSFSSLEEGPRVGDIEMCNEEGESIGTLDVSIEFEAGDVNFFQLMSSRLHTSDDD